MNTLQQFIIIDDDANQLALIRSGIKNYFGLPQNPKFTAIDKNCQSLTYKKDDAIIELIEVLSPSLDLLESIISKYSKNVSAIIVDMVWTADEKTDFYDQQDGLFNMEFNDMFFEIGELFKKDVQKLPGGLRFLYKWFSKWKLKFDIPPIVISKSVYFTKELKTSLRALGTNHFIDASDLANTSGIGFKIREVLEEYASQIQIAKLNKKMVSLQKDGLIIPSTIKDRILAAAQSDSTVLLTGEPGSGKNTLANFLHYNSIRKEQPLIEVDCSTIPPELTNSEFFGHIKGAFSNKAQEKKGRFELANNGTIFLDGVNKMALSQQQQLLTVLDNGEFTKIGKEQKTKVNVRVIASINEDPSAAIENKCLLPDLYFRLKVIEIEVPPLRLHDEDIVPLAEGFVSKYKIQYKRPMAELNDEAKQSLKAYQWVGNIRELENTIKKALTLVKEGQKITVTELDLEILNSDLSNSQVLDLSPTQIFEKQKILAFLKTQGWNITLLAELLKLSRPAVYSRLNRYGINGDDYKNKNKVVI